MTRIRAGHGAGRARLLSPRQRSEQYFTSSQTRSHFLRQRNGRPHCMQGFSGNSCFLRMAMWRLNLSERGRGVGEAEHVMSSDAVQMPLQAGSSLPLTAPALRSLALLLRTATDTSSLTRKQEQPVSLLQSRQEQNASLLTCTGEGTAKRRARALAQACHLRRDLTAGTAGATRLINSTPRPAVTRKASPTAKPQCSSQRPDSRSLGTAQPMTSSARRTS